MLSQIDKQLIRAYAAPRLAKLRRAAPPFGPRIAVIGNCQSYGVAYAMKLLDPTARVDHYSAITRAIANIDQLCAVLSDYDQVFSQDFPTGIVKGGDSQELMRRLDNALLFPTLNFAAFQPDLVYLTDATRGNRVLNGPLRPYHSALGVFAYRIGLNPDAAQALFNRNVYEAVGYLDVWGPAAAEFLQNAGSYDLDLSAELMSWSRRGVFMYSIVHPKPFVLADIARRLFAKAGLEIRNHNLDDYAIDDLARSEIFPVYPEIAELYGVRGAYLFKRGNFHISHGVGEFLTLPQYLSGCYAVYKKARPEQIAHPRVDAWLAETELSRKLVSLAQENFTRGLTPVL
ncbi:MAG TPA: WcbI family polysaccharide biosynthesis putative acetyltransferase [Methylocystis sp.]|nr:WcbI family polysaccharide biosynthesis putative acetyltransferase [Methylocystis sp.]